MSPAELRRLLEVVQLLQLHREVSERFLAGDTSLAASRARIALWLAQQLERRLPPQCSGFMKSGWRLLARMTRKRSISTRESDALHALLCLSVGRAVPEDVVPRAVLRAAGDRRGGAGQSSRSAREDALRLRSGRSSGGDRVMTLDYQAAAPRSSPRWVTRVIAWAVCLIILAFVVRALVKQFAQVNWSSVS